MGSAGRIWAASTRSPQRRAPEISGQFRSGDSVEKVKFGVIRSNSRKYAVGEKYARFRSFIVEGLRRVSFCGATWTITETVENVSCNLSWTMRCVI
jgi:hypothetical protein